MSRSRDESTNVADDTGEIRKPKASRPPAEPSDPPRRKQRPRETAEPTAPGEGPPPGFFTPEGTQERYEDIGLIGVGEFTEIRRVRDRSLNRVVAMRTIRSELAEDDQAIRRFQDEARILSQLQHPGIVPVHDVATHVDGRPFFTMKEISGVTLAEAVIALHGGPARPRVAEGRWTRRRLVGALRKAADTVAFAHARGVLHRDLRPDNLLLGPQGEVLVLGWGQAKVTRVGAVTRPDAPPTAYGVVHGAPGFIAPEVAAGQLDQVGPRVDVYAMGAILFFILAGRPPFKGRAGKVLRKVVSEDPPDIESVVGAGRVPASLAAVCQRAISRDAKARNSSMQSFCDALEDYLTGSRRRSGADELVKQAKALWRRYEDALDRGDRVSARAAELRRSIPPYAPLEDKAPLHDALRQLDELALSAAGRLGRAIGAAERALLEVPEDQDAHRIIGRALAHRRELAEARGDAVELRFVESRAGQFAQLEAPKTLPLHLATTPPGIAAELYQVVEGPVLWGLGRGRSLGVTPVESKAAPGRYVVRLHTAGRRSVFYPVHLRPGDARPTAPVAFEPERAGKGYLQIPGGPFAYGERRTDASIPQRAVLVEDFYIATYPVTFADYCDFLTSIAGADPAAASARAPRYCDPLTGATHRYWPPPLPGHPYQVPTPTEAVRWDPRWPVFGVSWTDARAYAAWRTREGRRYALPTERQWEKAARGVDGRAFPWGDRHDAALCKMRDSAPGPARPETVGAYATDRSVYGVRDLAGGVHEWCGDSSFDGRQGLRPVRGGSWQSSPDECRATARRGVEPLATSPTVGFRLVCLPE